ncbi:protein transport protein sft2, partial [Modicella reniformis]
MSSTAESNFRNAFNNFGARGGVAAAESNTTTSGGAFGRASNWLGGVRSQVSGYVPVALGGTPQPQEEDWLGLTWFQRMAGFAICVLGGVACFGIAFTIGLAVLPINPGKFATSFTLGSILFMARLFRSAERTCGPPEGIGIKGKATFYRSLYWISDLRALGQLRNPELCPDDNRNSGRGLGIGVLLHLIHTLLDRIYSTEFA